MLVIEILGGIFGGAAGLFGVMVGIAAGMDAYQHRKRSIVSRAAKVAKVHVRARAIKTPAIRERLEKNRAIIHASNEQALALKQQNEGKRDRHREGAERWLRDFAELNGGKMPQIEAGSKTAEHALPKKEKKQDRATVKPRIVDPEDADLAKRLAEMIDRQKRGH